MGEVFLCALSRTSLFSLPKFLSLLRTLNQKVDIRLPGKENSNSHGVRPVHQIISMKKWIRTSRLSIKNFLFETEGGLGCAREREFLDYRDTSLIRNSFP